MRLFATLAFALLTTPVMACEKPVCAVDPDRLDLARLLTFDDQPSGFGPGIRLDDLLVLEGAIFGERFYGQTAVAQGTFDLIEGRPIAPLTVIAGAPGQNLSITRLYDTNVLNGDGPAGYPATEATGEGAIAVQFDTAQSALAFDIRGGEGGISQVSFLRWDGSLIARLTLNPLAEKRYGFQRFNGIADIAGLLIESADPQGQALDNLAFDRQPALSALPKINPPQG